MSELEQELLDLLDSDARHDAAKEELLRLQIGREFERRNKRLLIWMWVWHGIGLPTPSNVKV